MLLRVLTSAMLVTRNWLTGAIPGGDKLKKHPLYRLLLDYPLRFAHALTGYLSQVPAASRVVLPGMLAICVAALAIGLKWFDPIVQQNGELHLIAFGLFLLFPAVILVTAAVLLIGNRLPRGGALNWLAAAAGALALLWSAALFVPTAIAAHATLLESLRCHNRNGNIPPWYCGVFQSESRTDAYFLVVYLVLPLLAAFAGGGLVAWLARQRDPSKREQLRCMTGMLSCDLRELAVSFKADSPLATTTEKLNESERLQLAKRILVAAKSSEDRNKLLRELRRRNPLGLP